jgi:DnaJ-domain-containing protein 1
VQSATLIEAYLDNLHPNWRDDVQRDGGTGQGHGSGSRAAMSREEALDILGLSPGATEAEIRAAHRELMLKVHPDRGGSDYLAAKINMAKDVLLNG